MSRILSLLLCISSCAPVSVPLCHSVTGEELAPQDKPPEIVSDLLIAYGRLFRDGEGATDDVIDLETLKTVEQLTSLALDKHLDDDAPHFKLIFRLHYKLRSYLSFLAVARHHEEELCREPSSTDRSRECQLLWIKQLKRDLVGMIAKQLRGAKSSDIDLATTNDRFYRQVTSDNFSLPETTNNAQFFTDLLANLTVASEKSIARYHTLFAFEISDPRTLCPNNKSYLCQQLKTASKQESVYTDIVDFTKLVNSYIHRANKINSDLYFIKKDNSSDEKLTELKDRYRQFLNKAMHFGLIPLFLTDTFRDKSGKDLFIDLNSQISTATKPLTEVTPYTVKQMVVNLKKDLVERWLELKDIKKIPKEEKIYQWLVANEAVTTKTVLQNPQYSLAVISLLNKYQDRPNNPQWLRTIKGVVSNVEQAMIAGMVGGFFGRWLIGKVRTGGKLLSITGRLSFIFALVGVVVNLPYIIISVAEYRLSSKRYTTARQAVQSGSSACTISATRLRQRVDASERIVVAGMIGLTLTAIILKPTIRLGEEVAFLWIGLVEVFASSSSDPSIIDFFISIVTAIDERPRRSFTVDDPSYRELILGDLPSFGEENAST